MHRVKGLEYNQIIIAGVNDGVVPLERSGSVTSDSTVKKEVERMELALLYVAATRAKKEVLVSSFGEGSRFLGLVNL